MSCQETHIGTLIPCGFVLTEDTAKKLLEENHMFYDECFYSGYIECFYEELSDKYFVDGNNNVYVDKFKEVDGDIFEATKQKDGSIKYIVSYYNGGCSHSGALQYALDNINKK